MVSILPSFQQSVLPSKATLDPFEAPAQVRSTKVMKYLLHLFCQENVKKIERLVMLWNAGPRTLTPGGCKPFHSTTLPLFLTTPSKAMTSL